MVTLYYTHGWNHGNHLRIFAFTREWVRRGCEVHFVAVRFQRDDPAKTRAYLEGLREARIITGFDEVVLPHPRVRGKVARAALFPRARDLILAPERRPVLRQLDEVARAVRPELFVYSARHLLFSVPRMRRYAPVAVDWTDSWALYNARNARVAIANRRWLEAGGAAWRALDIGLEERHYSRRADQNVFVSPVDARVHARLAGARVQTVGNGIREHYAPRPRDYAPRRLIFTGAMEFPPNHEAALWFIRQVLPHVVAVAPDVRFVVAGANPLPELRALAGEHVEVTGFVEDIRAEIAKSALYVAPLVSGSGFKNKVIEALAAGLNVVGTSLAFEFLRPELRALFRAADDPRGLAKVVLAALADPAGNQAAVDEFWARAGDEFEWDAVAGQLATAVANQAAA